MDEAKAYIDLAKKLGTPYVRVIITPNAAPMEGENILQVKRLYTELCAYAKGTGVAVLLETSGELADSSKMRKFMRDVDLETGGVLWDLHHPYRFFGESPAKTWENIGEWVRYLHVKDSAMQDGKLVYRMMGYGDVPVFDALKILSDHGYQGYVSLEWLKRWCPDLQEPGIVFAHYAELYGLPQKPVKMRCEGAVGICQRPLFFFRLSPVPFEHPDVLAVKLHRPVGAEQAGEDAVAVPFAEHLFVEVGADHGRRRPMMRELMRL